MLLACFLELHLNSRSWKHGRWYYKRFCYKHLYYLHEWIFQRFALGTRIFKDVATKSFFYTKKNIFYREVAVVQSVFACLLPALMELWKCPEPVNQIQFDIYNNNSKVSHKCVWFFLCKFTSDWDIFLKPRSVLILALLRI